MLPRSELIRVPESTLLISHNFIAIVVFSITIEVRKGIHPHRPHLPVPESVTRHTQKTTEISTCSIVEDQWQLGIG